MTAVEAAFNSRIISILGCFYLLKICIFLSYQSWSGFRSFVWARIKPVVDLKIKYGEWAVITGSTDGIGKEFALQLARRGMDIVLISRSDVKLQSTAQEIVNLYNVEVKTIQADFTSTEVYDKIRKGLEGLDVGILVNNVGILNNMPEQVVEQSDEFFKNIINVNILSALVNTKIVLKDMKRKNRGLIVNMGSQSGLFPVPYLGVYSCSKVFIDHFSSILISELAGSNVRVKCLRGGFIKTNLISHMNDMTKFYEKYFPIFLPDAKTYVESAMATLNTDVSFTCGYWPHSFLTFLMETFLSKRMQTTFLKIFLSNKFIWKK